MRRLALSGCLLVAAGVAAAAQSTASPTVQKPNPESGTPASTHLSAVPTSHQHRRKKKAVELAPPPPVPVPPVQQAPRPATIAFRDGTLRIDADNSSLVQILNQVAHETGMKVDGLGADERIYGQYGPGPVTSTLSKLLDGAGYNYVIVGGGPGTPATKLLLTGGPSGDAVASDVSAPAPATQTTPAEAPATQNAPEPVHPKTPQEIFNELRRMHPR